MEYYISFVLSYVFVGHINVEDFLGLLLKNGFWIFVTNLPWFLYLLIMFLLRALRDVQEANRVTGTTA